MNFDPVVACAGDLIGNRVPAVRVVALACVIGGHELGHDELTDFESGEAFC